MRTILTYQVILTIIAAALLLNALLNRWMLRAPAVSALTRARTANGEDGALVSLLIPARDEQRVIAACVESLASQDYPWLEILVLDDQSEDATASIVAGLAARYPAVRLLRGAALPDGWHGKAWACAQLAAAARGAWLLFLDADITLAPDCVSRAVSYARARDADLLTLMPRIQIGGAGLSGLGEALLLAIVPLTFIVFLPLGLVMGAPGPLFAGALGQFLLFRRASYLRLGGHAAVRTEIVEDMRLSQQVKRHGGRVIWMDGAGVARVRMYHGFAEAWRGIAKSAFAAINYSLALLPLGMAGCAAVFLAPYAFLAAGLAARPSSMAGQAALIWLPALQIALLWTAESLALARARLPLALTLPQPLTALAIMLTTLHAALQTELGAGVVWKGRAYQFNARATRVASAVSGATAWGNMLALARIAAALALVAAARMERTQYVAAALLLGWTAALFEQRLRKGAASRWSEAADVALSAAALGYLALSGWLALWQAAALVVALAALRLRLPWTAVAGVALTTTGGLLLLAILTRAPSQALVIWLIALGLVVAGPPLAHAAREALPWFQRPHSS